MLCATLALLSLIQPARWLWQTFLLIVLLGVVMAASRHWRAWLPGPLAVGTIVLYVTVVCTPDSAVLGLLPSLESLADLGRQLGRAMVAAVEEPPLGPNPQTFAPLVLVGLGLVTLVAVALAADLGRPALAGLPIAGPWILVGVLVPNASLVPATFTAVTYLALLAWGGGALTETMGARWPGATTGLGVIMAVAASLALVFAGPRLPFWGSQEEMWFDVLDDLGIQGQGPPGSTIDLGLDLTSSLRQNEDLVFFRTRPMPGAGESVMAGERLRLDARYNFDGRGWRGTAWRSVDLDVEQPIWPNPELVLTSDGLEPGWSTTPSTLRVDMAEVATADRRVPVSLGPRYLAGLPDFEYNALSDSVRLTRDPPQEWSYEVRTYRFDEATVATLAADSQTAPIASRPIPNLPHSAEIQALAESITADVGGDYAKLLALEGYFHSPEFTYSVDIDYAGTADPLWEFLEDKSGFCVHYATAMTIMARTLGFAARVAVGFAPGRLVDNLGTREVRGSDAHAWPEIYFERVGWVPFEPTPGIAGGLSDPDDPAAATPTPTAADETDPTAAPSDQSTAAPAATTAPAISQAVARWWAAVWPYAVGALALAGLVWGAWWLRRYRRAHATAERIWLRFQARGLRRGFLTPGQSVRAAAAALGERVDHDAARTALADLARLIEAERYARPGGDPAAAAARDAAARRHRDTIEAARLFARRP
jgi:transglutaminase-like putative cysteine protease